MEWYSFFPNLYAADTLHLTLEQDAIYRRLIDWYMVHRRPIPANDQAIANILRVGIDVWVDNKSVISEFFKPSRDGKLWHQTRCDKVLEGQDKRSRMFSEAGKKSAKIRQQQAQGNKGKSEGGSNHPSTEAPTEERIGEDRIDTNTENVSTPSRGARYAFEGQIVKLNAKHYDTWKARFSNLPDIDIELRGIDRWMVKNPKPNGDWFVAVERMLARANERERGQKRRPANLRKIGRVQAAAMLSKAGLDKAPAAERRDYLQNQGVDPDSLKG